MATLRFRAPEAERLDRALAGRPEVGSRALAERLIGSGAVLVEGRPRAKSHRLEGGEDILVELPPDAPPPAAEEMDLTVVWEDEHLLVVEKPPGVVVHPGAGQLTGTLVSGLLALDAAGGDEERPGIVHRLDRDTSGLLVVARSEEAFSRLQRLVRRRALERQYLALVRGRPRSRRGRIEAPIGRDRNFATRQSLDTATPRDAVTHFEVEELLPEHTLLRVSLETGRTHQIRVHLSEIGLPVLGDRVYGVPGLGLERQFLHACRLAFPHPITREPIDVSSELPGELQEALALASGD